MLRTVVRVVTGTKKRILSFTSTTTFHFEMVQLITFKVQHIRQGQLDRYIIQSYTYEHEVLNIYYLFYSVI